MKTISAFSLILFLLVTPSVMRADELSLGAEISVSSQDDNEYRPQVAFNSVHNEYLAVWHVNSSIFGRYVQGSRISASGSILSNFTIAYEDSPHRDCSTPDVAYDSVHDRYFVVWMRDSAGDGSDWDIEGRFIPWDGPDESMPSFHICTAVTQQQFPRVAWASGEDEFLVTWWNEGSGTTHSDISAQRIDAGDPVFPLISANFTVTSSSSEERVGPDIAYNSTRNEYLIVYQRMDDVLGNIYGVRLSGTGSILGGGDFGIAAWPDAETNPRVAASQISGEWAVAWMSDTSAYAKEIYARRVTVDFWGDVQTEAVENVAGADIDESYPDIAASGIGKYLISWEQQYSNPSGPFGIWARTLDESDALGVDMVVRGSYAGQEVDSAFPAICGSEGGFLVTWQQERYVTSGPSYQDIRARQVTTEVFSDGFEFGSLAAWSSHTP